MELEHKRKHDKGIFLELKKFKHKLDELLTYKAEGALRFTSQRYYEMGNRASRLLAYQLRKVETNRIISKIRHPNSKQIVVKPTDIAEAFAEYYKNLYNDSESKIAEDKTQAFLKRLQLPALSIEEADDMVQPILSQEILDSIKI